MVTMQKTCTQKLQPQKPWPRKMQKKCNQRYKKNMQLLDFFFLQNMHSSRICIFFLHFFSFFFAFSSSFCNFLNFGALTGGPPKMQKMHNSRICICFAFCFCFFFAYCSHFFCIFFQIFEDRRPSQKCKSAQFQNLLLIFLAFLFAFFFALLFCGRISFAFSDCIFFSFFQVLDFLE